MEDRLIQYFSSWGFSDFYASLAALFVLVAAVIFIALIVNFITKRILLSIIKKIAAKTVTKWDDILLETDLFRRLAHVIPVVALYFLLPLVFTEKGDLEQILQRIILSSLIIIMITVINSFLTAVNAIYSTYDMAKNRPIKGYLQIVRVIFSLMGFVWGIAILLDKSALGLLSGIGALSAVLMLVFKDSILGIVAAVQLSGNDMIRIGDWVSVPSMGADGDVIDIKLQTVSIQNFDKTIVNVPIYHFISSSFTNWRGMSEPGGRRIKRHLNIDMNSAKFCSSDLIETLKGVDLLGDFLTRKQSEIQNDNTARGIDTSLLINGRRLTNLGVFRAYIAAYLTNHPFIDENMTFLVRQLQPTDKGIPLEIYVFSRDQRWANYEGIQADIFDHLLASISFFELSVYQTPSSLDFQRSFKEKP